MAKRASVLRRRKSRSRLDVNQEPQQTPTQPQASTAAADLQDPVYYIDEPSAGILLNFKILNQTEEECDQNDDRIR